MFSKNWALMAVFSFLVICLVTTMAAHAEVDPGSASGFPFLLRYGYYDDKCEDLEDIVWSKMKTIVQLQHNAPAQLLRLMFHDCFIGMEVLADPVLSSGTQIIFSLVSPEHHFCLCLLISENFSMVLNAPIGPVPIIPPYLRLTEMEVLADPVFSALSLGTQINTFIAILACFTRASLMSLLVDFLGWDVITSEKAEGCDASVLLADRNENGTVEREAIPNRTLKGFNFIDTIKDEIEEECPGVVSCSDILVLATRDGIVLAGGPYYPVLTGRRDSKESFFDKAMAEIPRPNGNISETLRLFSLRGFDERETVALLGAHNIGRIGCQFIRPRLSNFTGTGLPDPTIPPDFVEELRRKCPDDNNTISNMLNDEHTDTARGLSVSILTSLDNHYYKTLMRGRGLLFADQQLMANEKTAAAVTDYAIDDGIIFRTEFAHAMGKLSNFGVLTGSEGEVRHSCSHLNS
ncbi:hypothetical protein KY290_015177 [Solanum tuberosum]|uniref:peroxidase n=1 Tax=Solanum tuberosum TaxID=4113 RepID=A0ABQ7VT11_SOLTU|nr:hypothetical protein KY290_015177 [Solanum tuberosum]